MSSSCSCCSRGTFLSLSFFSFFFYTLYILKARKIKRHFVSANIKRLFSAIAVTHKPSIVDQDAPCHKTPDHWHMHRTMILRTNHRWMHQIHRCNIKLPWHTNSWHVVVISARMSVRRVGLWSRSAFPPKLQEATDRISNSLRLTIKKRLCLWQ